MNRPTSLAFLIAIALGASSTRADLKLPGIFSDHMIVQRAAKIPIWGKADATEAVTVKAAGQTQTATAGADGKWRVVLDPIESAGAIEITVSGKNTVTIRDVLVGEVWLCSGQSNMGFDVKRAAGGAEAIKAANRPTMRLFTVGRVVAPDGPKDEAEGKWEICSPSTVGDFSAVAYFFGAELQDKLQAPVGLIQSSWGGTRAEAWIPREKFDSLKLPYEPAWTEQWLKPKQKPKAKKQEVSRPHQAPASFYNGMIAPLAGYAIRGAVWYQGETNTAYPADYRNVLGGLVSSWRDAWRQDDFPFLIVQLPNFLGASRDWAALRDSQAHVARELPNVGLAVTIDIGETKDIHPREKKTVGHRLSLLAEKLAYGRDIESSGPTFKSMLVKDGAAVVQFDHSAGGLVAKGDQLLGFEIAGADGKFVAADARIDGETVVVSAKNVGSPKAIRYAWANDPKCTLSSKAELPAAPFTATVK